MRESFFDPYSVLFIGFHPPIYIKRAVDRQWRSWGNSGVGADMRVGTNKNGAYGILITGQTAGSEWL